jgi:hypothetical protein
MLVTPCPACGAPNPASLPTPTFYRCEHCQYEGPPREADVPRIEALARTLREVEDRTLQLSRIEAEMLSSARGARAFYLLAFALLLLPVILTTGAVDWVSEVVEQPLPVLALAPAVLMLICGVAGAVVVYRRHKSLIAACAADPPRSGEETGRCNLCGAPLVSKPGAVVARCGFCGADNLVSKTTLERVRRSAESGSELFERRLRRRQQATRRGTRLAEWLVLGAGVLGCGVVLLQANTVLYETSAVNWAGDKLTAVDLHGRTCFGMRDRETVSFGPERSPDLPESLDVGRLQIRRLRVSHLRGRQVVLPDGATVTVTEPFTRANVAWIRAEHDGATLERPLYGLCTPDAGL